mmetsp:Transcript_1153/g.2882  ORF Transcript_1153/g.2882 Transcript_1153/m.2882 type:complete len:218 (+) Transcript_1153:451-1104(+)
MALVAWVSIAVACSGWYLEAARRTSRTLSFRPKPPRWAPWVGTSPTPRLARRRPTWLGSEPWISPKPTSATARRTRTCTTPTCASSRAVSRPRTSCRALSATAGSSPPWPRSPSTRAPSAPSSWPQRWTLEASTTSSCTTRRRNTGRPSSSTTTCPARWSAGPPTVCGAGSMGSRWLSTRTPTERKFGQYCWKRLSQSSVAVMPPSRLGLRSGPSSA